MNFMGALACFVASLTAVEKAMGLQPQVIFATDKLWLWWPAAVIWGGCSLIFFVRAYKEWIR